MSASVHGQGSSTATESVALRTELTGMAHLAKEFVLVSVGIGRIQHLVAQAAFEALLVPFQATGDTLFGGVHGFGAFRALGDLGRGERHLESIRVPMDFG